ncbi:MAG: tetratricopeptide repeat protein [Nitrospinaceae bacterium]|nr:MAG: tetratricopeptide repeat protein [Nitrospinaceae bacterium]
MNHRILASGLALLIAISTVPPAEATFPSKTVAHWEISQSQELNDPDYDRLQTLVREKKYTEALDLLARKKTAGPRESTPPILEGFVLNEMGKYPAALEAILAGQAIESRHPAIHYGFCQVYRNLGKLDLSERGCFIAIELHHETPEVYYESAQTQAAGGNMERAARELKTAARLAPGNGVYQRELGMALYYLGRIDEADQAFQEALRIDPGDLDAAYQLAYLYAARKNADAAKKYIMIILESRREHPKRKSAEILLDYVKNKEFDKLPLNVEPHQYHLGRSQALYREGRYGLSLLEIETAARLKPEDRRTQEILIGMTSLLSRLEPAEKAVRHFIELSQGNAAAEAKAYQELGDIRLLQGKIDEARTFYEKAKALGDPAGLAKMSLDEFPEAGHTRAPAISPLLIDPAEAMNQKGEVFAHYGMYQRAIAIYSMAIRMNPEHLDSQLNIATAQYKSRKYSRAISILERLLVTHPNHEHILAHRLLLAQAYVKNGDLADGLKNLEIVVRISPQTVDFIKTDPAFENLRPMEAFQKLVNR